MPSPKDLTTAVRDGDVSQIVNLTSHPDVSVIALDEEGHSALHWAAMSEKLAIIALILSKAKVIDILSSAQAQKGQTPLHWACVAGHIPTIKLLLEAGANPTLADANGYNTAIHAAQYGRLDVLHFLIKREPRLVNSIDAKGHSLIQWAAYYGHHSIIFYLLTLYNVDPNLPDHASVTPLHRAAQCDNYVVIDALLRHKADLSVKNESGKTAKELAPPGTRSKKLLEDWESGKMSIDNPVGNRQSLRKYFFVIFYYVVMLISYFAYQNLIASPGIISAGMNIALHCLLFIGITTHSMATFWDPGELKKGNKQDFLKYIDKCIEEGNSETRLLPSSYCYTCLIPKPLRAKHSRERDACVKVFDHECPWVNNTVGIQTHKPLLIFALTTGIVELYFIYVVGYTIYKNSIASTIAKAIMNNAYIFTLALLHIGLMIFCFMLFATHVQMISQGRTTYELLLATKENRVSEKSPYDKGLWRNLVAFVTSTGPGTGNPWTKTSLSTVSDVVFSSGKSNQKSIDKKPTTTSSEQSTLIESEEIV